MLALFAERGADPGRPGKKDPLDCLVRRLARDGEPSWVSPLGGGRPGWHIECTAIALDRLGAGFDVQAGGTDLIFPHHEMCAAEARAATGGREFAKAYVHSEMVGLDGEKISKSKPRAGFAAAAASVDPMAIGLRCSPTTGRLGWDRRSLATPRSGSIGGAKPCGSMRR
jgi:L-cysteine:1D-myo-inositol 2-amino-2-deoxy-alpha-D-glucopyranoside ligase